MAESRWQAYDRLSNELEAADAQCAMSLRILNIELRSGSPASVEDAKVQHRRNQSEYQKRLETFQDFLTQGVDNIRNQD